MGKLRRGIQAKQKVTEEACEQAVSGAGFLLAIAGIGVGEADLAERDEEILAQEIDPVRGWGFDDGVPAEGTAACVPLAKGLAHCD